MGGIKLKTEVLDNGACALCGACLDWCPYLKNLEDHLVMAFDCTVEEGRCYAVCPRTFTNWGEITAKFMPASEASAIGHCDAVFKVKSAAPVDGQQDGGTVTALVKAALKNNIEAALLTGSKDNITPQPLIADEDTITTSAGSRFLAATSLRKLAEARAQGIKSLAVVGRPCQIQALRKIQMNRPQDLPVDGMIAIGLFCMWSLSWHFKDYIDKEWPGSNIKRVAIPRNGLEVTTDQGVKLIPVDKAREFIRPGCNYCLDMTSELADISVGALESEPGWNTVIIRTPGGRELFEKACSEGDLRVEPYPADELNRLRQAADSKKIRSLKTIRTTLAKPFIDLGAGPYQEILSRAEGKVNN